MRTIPRRALAALALAGLVAGCDDYLSGPELTTDPNRPSEASIEQLYHGVQINQFVWHTGSISRIASMWVQQMAGTDRQYQSIDQYDVTEDDFTAEFSAIYIGGGLVDMRQVQQMAAERNDRVYAGIAKVWEALLVGMAASFWGDLPYSEAVGEAASPALDRQEQVYAGVQSLLDEAIADLQSGQGPGPGALDLVYGGDRQRWIAAAHTLKARFYMHWAEPQLGGGTEAGLANIACAGDCIQKARDAAQSGIGASTGDFRTHHSANPGEQNLWYQFNFVNRPGYMSAGEAMVGLLRSRNDPRLTDYFAPVGAQVVGAPPGGDPASTVNPSRAAPSSRQPLVTHAENLLLLAESQARLGNAGAALTALNAARALAGLGPRGALTGTELLREIATESYIALFQNAEAWNVHKRTCVPALTPPEGPALAARFFYGTAERNANRNIPPPGEVSDRNRNDPRGC